MSYGTGSKLSRAGVSMNVVSPVMEDSDLENSLSAQKAGIQGLPRSSFPYQVLVLNLELSTSLPPADTPPQRHRDRLNSRARDRPSYPNHSHQSHYSRSHSHSGREPQAGSGRTRARTEELIVDAIFSAHSDGLMVILRLAT